MRPNLFHRGARQLDVILPRQVDDRLQSDTSIEMPMEIDEGKSRIDY
jgi:hypothetical protein